MSLRRRLLAIVIFVMALSLIAGAALTYWHALKKIEVEMQSASEVGASTMRDALAGIEPAPGADQHLKRIVRAFDGDRHLMVRFVGTDGTVTAASRVRQASDPAPSWLIGLLTGPPKVIDVDMPAGLERYGRIQFIPDPVNEVGEVWDDARLKLILVGGFCASVLALLYATIGRALRPLENLSSALGRVGQGDYRAHVDEEGPQELKIIYKAFNSMTEALDAAERQNQMLAEQLSTVQEEERSDIARDLHDEIGPFLFAVDADAQTLPALIAKGAGDDAVARSKAIRQSVGHMQKHLRSVLSRLRPALLLDLGLVHAVDNLVAFWRTRRPGVTFEVDVDEERFAPHIEETAFRILQEGTSNAIRHGQPKHVSLSAREGDARMLVVEVSDDGRGLSTQPGGGFGIKGMTERVRPMGGRISLTQRTDCSGLTLRAEIPLPPTAKGPVPPHDIKVVQDIASK